ncbi:neuroglobin-like [Brachionus plicatilis]|uniref:Neuroglobin-like n=1 Tax=Brachionus plicatilis TaxID=10195 RepID=A0A3M7P2G7_BRAPC|nr:neuroglobin-like [Brachionus plicatilis]
MGCHSTKELKMETLKKNDFKAANGFKSDQCKIFLSPEDIKIIRSSWRDLTKKGDFKTHGINVMIKIFQRHPEIKHIWKFAAKLNTEEEMRENPQLRSHGNNIFEAINAAVNTLEKNNRSNSSLVELGKKHTFYGAKKCYFHIMQDAFIEVLSEALGSEFNEQMKIAWLKCFEFITCQMSKGLVE